MTTLLTEKDRHTKTQYAVSVSGLSKSFQAKVKEAGVKGSWQSFVRPTYKTTEAVKNVNFCIAPGELVAFIGPNGAGKSTTIKMLNGILHPTSGSASVLGLTPWKDRQILSYNIASVFGQRSQLWYHLPPIDAFNLLSKIYELDPADYRKRIDYLIELFEVKDFVRTPVRKLSLGERMRCEIAASLLHRPKIIFLDEPTIGLDVIAKSSIRDLLCRMNQEEGTTIFLTSHDAGDIEKVCKRVIVVNHGSIVLDTPVSKLRRRYMRSKIVDLKLESKDGCDNGHALPMLNLPGTSILKNSEYGLKLEVDTEAQRIEDVISQLMTNYIVHDITIEDPPLEEIIASIYQQPYGEEEDDE